MLLRYIPKQASERLTRAVESFEAGRLTPGYQGSPRPLPGPVETWCGLTTQNIAGISSTTPGSGGVQLYNLTSGTLNDQGISVTAFNLGSSVSSGVPVLLQRDPISGNFVFDDDNCCSSSSSGGPTYTGTAFAVWLWQSPGDTLTGLQLSVTSAANSGTVYANLTPATPVSTTPILTPNSSGYNIVKFVFQLPGTLASGSYWLNLQNAVESSFNPTFWDQSSGASSAVSSGIGSIASETFQVLSTSGVVLYDNTNSSSFSVTAYTISNGFIVSDSFTI